MKAGYTLIEMLIVVAIAAVAFTGVALSLGATSRAKLRSSCWTMVAGIRYAYSRAVTAGMTTRLVMDFEKRNFRLEETSGRVVLNREDETGEGLRRQDVEDDEVLEGDAGPAAEPTGLFGEPGFSTGLGGGGQGGAMGGPMGMMGMMGMMGSGQGAEGNGFADMFSGGLQGRLTDPFLASMQDDSPLGGPVGYRRARFAALTGRRGEPRQLEGDTQFVTVFTPHEPAPRTEGRAFVYFFPGGVTEHSIIQLSDGEDKIYSIEIHPLTGRAVIHLEEREPDGELDELQESGE